MSCAIVARAQAADVGQFNLLKLGGNTVHWQSGSVGHPPAITYGLLRASREFDGARNCRKLGPLDDLAPRSQLSEEMIRREVAAAFAMWQAAANINFLEAETPETANILIGAQLEPEGWAFTNVSYDGRSPEAVKPITQSLICLNPLKHWKVGFDGNLKVYDIRYTIAHEIGHAIGLDHPNGDQQIMGYRYEEHFRDLQAGDVAGATLLYGARQPEAIAAETGRSRLARQSSATRVAKHWGARAFIGRARPTRPPVKKVLPSKRARGLAAPSKRT
jgi:hypothetical protein